MKVADAGFKLSAFSLQKAGRPAFKKLRAEG
jgi:hypothetical protein